VGVTKLAVEIFGPRQRIPNGYRYWYRSPVWAISFPLALGIVKQTQPSWSLWRCHRPLSEFVLVRRSVTRKTHTSLSLSSLSMKRFCTCFSKCIIYITSLFSPCMNFYLKLCSANPSFFSHTKWTNKTCRDGIFLFSRQVAFCPVPLVFYDEADGWMK
jgi:hypothetical protein